MKKRFFYLITIGFIVQGCVISLGRGDFHNAAKIKQVRQEFSSNLQKTNVEREKQGLLPLDWCMEAYKFDKEWAKEDVECRKRIKVYENGYAEAMKPRKNDDKAGGEDKNSATR